MADETIIPQTEPSTPDEEGLAPETPEPMPTEPALNPLPEPTPSPEPTSPPAPVPTLGDKFLQHIQNWRDGLMKAVAKKKEKRDLRLLKILEMASAKGGQITNRQVQTAFRCSQISAYRYLRALEKQGKLRRVGGHNTPTYEFVR